MGGRFIGVSTLPFVLAFYDDADLILVVEALRTILFGTHSRIGLDFGVLFIWIAVSLALYPVATFIMRWKIKRGFA